MRYLVPCLLVLPLLNSCTVIEEQYYERGYYAPAPRVEVRPNDPHRHYHVNNGYRPVPTGRVHHGHSNGGGNAVVINPRSPKAQVEVQGNVHGHVSNSSGTVHGHTNNTGAARGHTGNVHGHGESDSTVVIQHPQNNQVQANSGKQGNRGNVQGHQKNTDNQNKSHGHS